MTERDQSPPANGSGSTDPDAALVAQAQRELPYRTFAFEALMRRHQSLLFGVCRRILASHADAEDVCQDVMFTVFGNLQRFEGRSSFKTWMLRIAKNTCFSLVERRRRAQEVTAAWSQEAAEEPPNHLDEEAHDLDSLLAQLKPAEREILTLRFAADLNLQEIAEICGLGLSATKMRLYRATEQLRTLAGIGDE